MMKMARIGLGVGVALGALTAGCNQPTSSGPATIDQFSARSAQAFCGLASRCDSYRNLPGLIVQSSGGNCEAQLTAFYENYVLAPYRDAIDAGHIVYRADRAGACFDALGAVSCEGLDATPSACQEVFQGTLADGAACTMQEECSATSTCTGGSGSCGTCTHVPQLGEACTDTTGCGTGSYCDATSMRCTAAIAQGGACTPDGPNRCANNLVCVPSTSNPAQGTCSATPIVGAGESCASARCQDGLTCAVSSTGSTCRAPRTDGTCQLSFSGPGDCGATQACNASFGADGTCVAIPTTGQACTSTCQAPARCVDDGSGGRVCLVPHANGEACTGRGDCWSGVCTGSVCEGRPLCSAP
ncbi:MAG: hypothetical protein U0234_06690 [Sandaracinus sp.]